MKLLSRKILAAAAPLAMAAAITGCGTARPATRSASFPAPVTASATTPAPAPLASTTSAPAPVAAVELVANTLASTTAAPEAPAPEPAAEPMCDLNGRPLAGNVRGKGEVRCKE